jgi:hypothetical protein
MCDLYDFSEAAEKLRVSETWLRRHSSRLPRTKLGRTVLFSDDDLQRIREMHHIEPGTTSETLHNRGKPAYMALKPLPSRSRRPR